MKEHYLCSDNDMSVRVFKEACEHVSSIAEEELDVDVICCCCNVLQIPSLPEIDSNLQREKRNYQLLIVCTLICAAW